MLAIGLSWAYRELALAGQIDAPGDWLVAVVAALATTLGLESVFDGFSQHGLTAALRRSERGREPVDGETVAVIGTLHPLGEGLRSPLRDRLCVAYDYQMRSDETPGPRAEGRGLAPCVVRGTRVEWRLLDFPDLGFLGGEGEDRVAEAEARVRARALLARAREGPRPEGDAVASRSDAPLVEDRVHEPIGDEEVATLILRERSLPVGARARVYGTWSEERGGLVHGPGERGRLWIAPPEVAGFASRFGAGLVILVVVHALLYYPWVSARNARSGALGESLCRAVERGSVRGVTALLETARVESRCIGGGTPLHRSGDAAITRLLLGAGADVEAIDDLGRTPLQNAVIDGDLERTRALLEAGADMNRSAGSSGSTPLWQAAGYSPEIEALLLAAGAVDDRLGPGSGTLLTGDGGPVLEVCRRYLGAVHAGDVAALRALSTGEHEGRWGTPVIDDLAALAPIRVERFVGYATRDAATVSVFGPLVDGAPGQLTLQLVLWDTGWRVHRSSPGFALEAPEGG